jgi:alkylated DNA repair dioxygenase AlkB
MQLYFSQPPETQTLVDDESGRIIYHRNLFDEATIAAWFERLRSGIEWRSEEVPMYDRIVAVPRLVASFKLDDELPEPIARMVPDVEAFCKVHFTSAGLNLYRDGNDSVAPHGDRLEPTPEKAPVALVSLGAVRRMTIRSRFKPKRILDLDLEPGSLLVMSFESHLNYDHAIPKTKDKVGPRISVAFRKGRVERARPNVPTQGRSGRP